MVKNEQNGSEICEKWLITDQIQPKLEKRDKFSTKISKKWPILVKNVQNRTEICGNGPIIAPNVTKIDEN